MVRAQSVAPPSSDKPARLARKVLVVDDQPELKRILQRRLSRAGYTVLAAADAASALALASAEQLGAVISDVRMPDMGGVELLQRLHERDPDLPVLLVSGSPDLETALKAVEHGAFEYLTKPVAFEKLSASLERAVALRRQRLEANAQLEQYRSGERRRQETQRSPTRETWTGERLDGRYRVGRLLGSGGMGAVYEGTREDLGMAVAIKILHASLAEDPAFIARFRREAETVGRLRHPNIVHILDFSASDAGPAFLVMERLDGVSLRQELLRRGWLAAERSVFIASQVLAALGAVHRAQVVHRDIKPENVFLTAMSGLGDIVKLLDFGVAKVLSLAPGQTLTQGGGALGTPAYMAPEQARGARVDLRCDLYSVGAILYECLAGQTPFSGDNYNALLFAIQQGRPTPLVELRSDLDPGLIEVVEQSMAPDPASRFQSADEMGQALAPWLHLDPAGTPPESSAFAFAPTIAPPSESKT